MKKITLLALLVSAFTLGVFARGKQPVAFNKLPEAVKTEIKKNFTEDQIQFITAKKEGRKRFEYTFIMVDNTKLVCDTKAQLRSIESQKGVMDVFIPEKILSYVQTTFPNTTITEYKRENGCQKVELNDKMLLLFNKKGKFLRID